MAVSVRGTITLAHVLDRYLSVRRSLGYDLGTAERALRRFVQYADEQGVNHITTDLFLGWQGAFGNARRSTWGARFIMVRLFSHRSEERRVGKECFSTFSTWWSP